MVAQKSEKLDEVAPIGRERMGRDAALAGEFIEPLADRRGKFRVGAAEGEGRGRIGRGADQCRTLSPPA